MFGDFAQRVVLCIWPSAIFLLASQCPAPLACPLDPLLLMALGANLILYTAVGAVLWVGFTKKRIILLPLAFALMVLWWRMWTL